MNWKTIVLGGLAMYVVMFAVSMATGPLIHERLLDADYAATESFWRPELRTEPPDLAALMPRWITTGVLTTMIIATIYNAIANGLGALGWKNGLKYGFICSLFMSCYCAGWSGLFDLPDKIWIVWALESLAYYLPGGALLGYLHSKFA